MLNAVECEKRDLVAKLDNVSREKDTVQDEKLEIETDLQQKKKENSDLRKAISAKAERDHVKEKKKICSTKS